MGITSYTSYILSQRFRFQLDIYISRSEIYQLGDLFLFMKEAFVKKYYPSLLPET